VQEAIVPLPPRRRRCQVGPWLTAIITSRTEATAAEIANKSDQETDPPVVCLPEDRASNEATTPRSRGQPTSIITSPPGRPELNEVLHTDIGSAEICYGSLAWVTRSLPARRFDQPAPWRGCCA
jgi:hypothetical protein